MSKQVYISADYDENGDRDVVEELVKWGKDNKHKCRVKWRKLQRTT